jgi:hypothetical protein
VLVKAEMAIWPFGHFKKAVRCSQDDNSQLKAAAYCELRSSFLLTAVVLFLPTILSDQRRTIVT